MVNCMTAPPWIGAHVSAAGGVELAPERGARIGATCMQVFTANQRQWTPRPLTDAQVEAWWAACPLHGIERVVVHASYLANMSAIEEDKLSKSRDAMTLELERSQRLGVHGVVLHPGSHMGAGEDAGNRAVAESLSDVLERTEDLYGPLICGEKEESVRILLENTAGQGTNLGWRFEHLADIRRHLNAEHRERVGTCLDTCHTFAAGYDISTPAGWNATWREFDEIVGLDTVGAMHLNDSKRECGSRRDRHDGIGKGEIGETAFRLLMHDERFHHIPMALETPSGMEGWAEEIALLRDWAVVAAP